LCEFLGASVLHNDVDGKNDARDVSKNCQENADEKVLVTGFLLQKHSEGRKDHSGNKLDDI